MRSFIPFFCFLTGFAQQALAFPLKVIQLNTWGVPLMVEDTFRYGEAMRQIEARAPDVVMLEEVFSKKGKHAFHSEAYPYDADGPRAFPKLVSSGVRILSRYPIVHTAQTVFRKCNGTDCLSRKGALLAVIELPGGWHVNLVATHLDSSERVNIHLSQLAQIRTLIEREGDADAPLVLGGDLNFKEDSIEYPYAMKMLQATDAWRTVHPGAETGYTDDSFENRYGHDYALKLKSPFSRGRIDYVLSRNSGSRHITPIQASVIFNEEPLLSDHYGVEASFEID
ncbi:MAG: hypothetical protein EBX52_08450 [Proteobacteria bacterium]|nr:hypothetical protein [Pseudomonadota bacterium]